MTPCWGDDERRGLVGREYCQWRRMRSETAGRKQEEQKKRSGAACTSQGEEDVLASDKCGVGGDDGTEKIAACTSGDIESESEGNELFAPLYVSYW